MKIAVCTAFALLLLSGATGSALAKTDATLDAPPAGLVPSTIHLSQILAEHAKASGKRTGGNAPTVETWTFTNAGVDGTERLERNGGDYHSVITNGPLQEEYGQFEGTRWHRDYNGFTSTTTSEEDESFLPLRALDTVFDAKNDISVAGETTGDSPAYVLKIVQPHYKHPEYVFIDKKSALITRVEYGYGKRRIVSTYDDYRLTDGINEPWHLHDSDGRTQLDDDWKRTAFAQKAVPPANFAPPHAAAVVSEGLAEGVPFPVRMIDGDVVIRISVGGRGLDFLLDSGEHDSVIDRNVAHDLNLPTFGAVTKLNDGTDVSYDTRIDDLTAGPVRIHNFALTAENYNYDESDDVKAVGVLGYDFLAGLVLHIDYANNSAELIPRSKFTASTQIPDSMDIPFTLDDGVPMVPMRIGSATTQRVILNTASSYTIVFGQYIDAHNGDFTDEKGAEHRQAVVPFADEGGFGTQATLWMSRVNHLRFGPADYQNVPVIATNFSYGSSADAVDGILGENFLQFFDLYLDYADQRIVIKPNANFFKIFHKNQ